MVPFAKRLALANRTGFPWFPPYAKIAAALFQSLEKGIYSAVISHRGPNPERGIFGLLNAKERHSGKRA
jgi:hypothetical protein